MDRLLLFLAVVVLILTVVSGNENVKSVSDGKDGKGK